MILCCCLNMLYFLTFEHSFCLQICHNKSGEINPVKVKTLVECYIKKIKHSRKKADKKKSSKLS